MESRSRKRQARGLVLAMFSLFLIIVTLGVYSATRIESISIAGYIPEVVLWFGSFLGVLGLFLQEKSQTVVVNDFNPEIIRRCF